MTTTEYFKTNYANLNHKWVMSSNKLNELYVQVGQSFGDWKPGYPGLTNLSVTGGFDLGGSSTYPQGRTDWIYQLIDNYTWTLSGTRTGEHSVKAGAQVKIFESESFVSLVYNRGYDRIGITNTNAGRPGTANINGAGAIRPDPRYTNVSFYTNQGEIRYKGLIADVRKRMSNRVSGEVAYTLSKTTDNAFNFVSSVVVPERPDLQWGPGSDDRRHVVTGNVVYLLPMNLTLATIVEYRTEAPLNITVARDVNGDGLTGDWVNEAICRNVSCPRSQYSRNSVREVLTEEANRLRTLFGLSAIPAFENNPKVFNADVTMQWAPTLGGSRRVKVSAEAFNVFNFPLRNAPTESITSANFGRITLVTQARAIQFTLQVDF